MGGTTTVAGSAGKPSRQQRERGSMSGIDRTAVEIPHHSPEAILAHPRFALARTAYVEAILGLYEYDPFMNRLLIEAGRSVIFFNILCLHAAYDESDRATWPTLQLLQRSVREFGVSSPRRVHDIVARFIETGYVRSDVAPSDRRAHILAPTDKMLAHDLAWLEAFYRPLEVMFPDPGYGLPMRRDPAYRRAHRKVGTLMFSYAARLMAANPGVMLFMGREAGMMILIKLVQRAGEARGGVARRFSFADIADRFGISRTHVRTTLQDAEAEGLVQMSDRSVALTPPLVSAFDRFVADIMAGHDLMFRTAMRDLEGNLDGSGAVPGAHVQRQQRSG
ncbi:MAG TPA: hypothetical protein VH414_08995 [Lichenihabitans sp.]|jgi:DNA-binding MarR family transcriptional regulator|nr:hypothetical protein [Lichenihabitans sp.]